MRFHTSIAIVLLVLGLFTFSLALTPQESTPYGSLLSSIAREVNLDPFATWKAAENHRFLQITEEGANRLGGTRLTDEEKLVFYDTPRRFEEPGKEGVLAPPDSFDSRTAWPGCWPISEIYDQANCGSDYAISTVTTTQDRICIVSKQQYQVELSSEDLLECCTNCGQGCGGGSPASAWDYIMNEGVVTGGGYMNENWCKPYFFAPCSHTGRQVVYPPCGPTAQTPRCYYNCPNRYYSIQYGMDLHFANNVNMINNNQMTTEISTNGPIQAVMILYQDFLTYQSGVYKHQTGAQIGTLSVKIIGYGVENNVPYWLCANSWNETWGDHGYFKIARGTNECNIESKAMAPRVSNQVRSRDRKRVTVIGE